MRNTCSDLTPVKLCRRTLCGAAGTCARWTCWCGATGTSRRRPRRARTISTWRPCARSSTSSATPRAPASRCGSSLLSLRWCPLEHAECHALILWRHPRRAGCRGPHTPDCTFALCQVICPLCAWSSLGKRGSFYSLSLLHLSACALPYQALEYMNERAGLPIAARYLARAVALPPSNTSWYMGLSNGAAGLCKGFLLTTSLQPPSACVSMCPVWCYGRSIDVVCACICAPCGTIKSDFLGTWCTRQAASTKSAC